MLLALNTSTQQFGIALLRENGTPVANVLLPKGKGHFGNLMPTVDFLLSASDLSIQDITCIAIASGPGSFTGLRVGLSLAKGLSHALHLPLIGISTLEAMASEAPLTDLPVAPMLYSRKNEVFTALFTWNKDRLLVREGEDICLRWKDLPEVFKGGTTLFIGNDFEAQGHDIQESLGARALLAPPHHWHLNPVSIGVAALKRLEAGDFDDPFTLRPMYMRPPDIRPNPFPLLQSPHE
ncbi:MAG: tRNA (adenosine(37)-N6)-threonylcarbamoyltransferase complex dimerization subunit type 1 TsaB [Desulfatiglandaceae bacterium]